MKKRVFVTGFTGTLGKTVTEMLLIRGHEVIGYSRDEQKQRQFHGIKNLTTYLGDVRDERRLLEATRSVDLILHFAALKCVDTLQLNPEESIATNIYGTENVLTAQRLNRVQRVVFTSTDKACYPINVYGMSKAIAEELVLRNPNNVVCRYGNVIGSRGSVVPTFVKSLLKESCVEITDDQMTRFWIPVSHAAGFVLESAFGEMGGLMIPPIRSASVLRVAKTIASILGIESPEVKIVGVRLGEKLHENLIGEADRIRGYKHDSQSMDEDLSDDELKVLLQPAVEASIP